MNRTNRIAASLLGAVLVLAAGAARAADSFVTPPSAGLTQRVPVVTDDAANARIKAFEKRNPRFTVDRGAISKLRGDVVSSRASAPGAPRATPLTAVEAEAKARAFAAKNVDLLGLTTSELAGLKATTTARDRWWQPRVMFAVLLAGSATQRGFEGVRGAERTVMIWMQVYDDGEVGGFQSSAYDLPALRIRSTGALSKDDPRVLAQIVGQPFESYEPVSAIPGTYQSTYRRRLLAPIASSDVESVSLHLVRTEEANATVFTLAYAVHLRRGSDYMSFDVDADTGAVLRASEPPGPVVP
ncbi:MAG: hypothetical protein KIT84_21815 [Labilithrix sp.]|nr:hypothetical protein [Labilithrix sp.]MCW5813681.1 hypothetical protein [Labilithrix sp.]